MRGEMAGNELTIRLTRDCLSRPWGFRMQGGADIGFPLTVQRVFSGSPAEGVLHRGDIILRIDNYDTTNVLHKEAQDLVRIAPSVLTLILRRSGHSNRWKQSGPLQTENYCPSSPNPWGSTQSVHTIERPHAYNNSYDRRASQERIAPMMSQSLNFSEATSGFNDENDDDGVDYSFTQQSVQQRKQLFQQSNQPKRTSASLPRQRTSSNWNQPSQATWRPQTSASHQSPWRQSRSSISMTPNRNQSLPGSNFGGGHNQDWNQPALTSPMSHSGQFSSSVRMGGGGGGAGARSTPGWGTNNSSGNDRRFSHAHHVTPFGNHSTTLNAFETHNNRSFGTVPHNRPVNVNVYASAPRNFMRGGGSNYYSQEKDQSGLATIHNYRPLEVTRRDFHPAYPAHLNVPRPATSSFVVQSDTNTNTNTYSPPRRSHRSMSMQPQMADFTPHGGWNSNQQPHGFSSNAPEPSRSSRSFPIKVSTVSLGRPGAAGHNQVGVQPVQIGFGGNDWGVHKPSGPAVPRVVYPQAPSNTDGPCPWAQSELIQIVREEDAKRRHGSEPPRHYDPHNHGHHGHHVIKGATQDSWNRSKRTPSSYPDDDPFGGSEF